MFHSLNKIFEASESSYSRLAKKTSQYSTLEFIHNPKHILNVITSTRKHINKNKEQLRELRTLKESLKNNNKIRMLENKNKQLLKDIKIMYRLIKVIILRKALFPPIGYCISNRKENYVLDMGFDRYVSVLKERSRLYHPSRQDIIDQKIQKIIDSRRERLSDKKKADKLKSFKNSWDKKKKKVKA